MGVSNHDRTRAGFQPRPFLRPRLGVTARAAAQLAKLEEAMSTVKPEDADRLDDRAAKLDKKIREKCKAALAIPAFTEADIRTKAEIARVLLTQQPPHDAFLVCETLISDILRPIRA